MKMFRVHLALWVVLVGVGFLLGYIPEYLKNRDLRALLADPQTKIDSLELRVQMSEIRDLASLMLLELSRQNYGLARDYSDQYYTKVKDAADAVHDPKLKQSLEDLAATQSSLGPSLIAANPTSLTASQPIIAKTFEVTASVKSQ